MNYFLSLEASYKNGMYQSKKNTCKQNMAKNYSATLTESVKNNNPE